MITASQPRTEEGPFPGSGTTLFRRSVFPASTSPAGARLAIVHGYGDHSGRYLHFMQWLAVRGIESHALDLRGQGQALGRRGHVTRWEEYLDDVQAFLSLLTTPPDRSAAPLFLLGHSHGGLVVSAALEAGLPGVAGGILSAPYVGSLMRVPAAKVRLAQTLDKAFPWLPVHAGLRNEWMSRDAEMLRDSQRDPLIVRTATPRWYLSSRKAQEQVMERAREITAPLLVLIGDADPISDPAVVREFFQRVNSADKTLQVYPGFLHELLREQGREEIFGLILAWMLERASSR